MESYNPCVFIESYCQFRYNSVKKQIVHDRFGGHIMEKSFLTWTAAALGTAISFNSMQYELQEQLRQVAR